MSKEFICKGCKEKFNKDMQSNNVDYCYICNEFYTKKYIADLEAKLVEKEERLKAIDNWKENYGYTNYEDIYMLEDLQSRTFQSEDDTNVVNNLLDYLNISDENEILPKIKQQLAEKDKELEQYKNNWYIDIDSLKINENVQKIANQKAISELEKVKEFNIQQVFSSKPLDNFINNQIKQLKENNFENDYK